MAGVALRLRPVLIVAAPWAPWVAAVVVTAAAGCSRALPSPGAGPALPAAMAGVAAIVRWRCSSARLPAGRPEAVEQMARAVVQHSRGPGDRVGPYRVFVRNLIFYTRLPQEDLFDEPAAVRFLQSPDRVLLVVRPADLAELERARV